MASNHLPSPSGSRKRSRNEDKWVQNVAKRQRNLGQEYVSKTTGKTVNQRKVGPPCTCKKKCYEQVGVDNIQSIFDQFWSSGDPQIQNAFIQNHSIKGEVHR